MWFRNEFNDFVLANQGLCIFKVLHYIEDASCISEINSTKTYSTFLMQTFYQSFCDFPSFFLIHICVHTLRILYQAEVCPPLTVITLSVNSPIKDRDFQNG